MSQPKFIKVSARANLKDEDRTMWININHIQLVRNCITGDEYITRIHLIDRSYYTNEVSCILMSYIRAELDS